MLVTFYACLAASTFGFMVYHLRGNHEHAAVRAGTNAAVFIIALFLMWQWATA